MDNEFFHHDEHPDLFLDASLHNNGTFDSLPDMRSSHQEQIDNDASSPFVRSHDWWTEPLSIGPGTGGMQSNNLQPDGLLTMSNASYNQMMYKLFTNSQFVQAPSQGGPIAPSSTGNARVRGDMEGAAIHLESEHPIPQKGSPFYVGQDLILEAGYMSAFNDSFRGSDDGPIPSVLFQSEFTAEDLGRLPSFHGPDDTASLNYTHVSCNSKCTSSVCENENCSVTGIPCDDPTCMENTGPEGLLGLENHAPTPITPESVPFLQPHAQPCNHTESEHAVARTLEQLGVYGKPPTAGEQLFDGIHRPCPNPPHLSHNYTALTPNDEQTQQRSIPPLVVTPSDSSNQERHICQWAGHDEQVICGAEFASTKELHEHLCGFHINKMASQTGFACSWAGCSRKQDKSFVTRGKLRRHVTTHSSYKPFTCSICNLGFSGQQALQQHERIHTGEKPFKCSVPGCNMAFKQKSALTMHSRVHSGEKPLHCTICGKAFPESSNLAKHRKTHAVKSDKHTCKAIVNGNECGRTFRRLDQLRRHRQTHVNPGGRKAARSQMMTALSPMSGEKQHEIETPLTPSETQ